MAMAEPTLPENGALATKTASSPENTTSSIEVAQPSENVTRSVHGHSEAVPVTSQAPDTHPTGRSSESTRVAENSESLPLNGAATALSIRPGGPPTEDTLSKSKEDTPTSRNEEYRNKYEKWPFDGRTL